MGVRIYRKYSWIVIKFPNFCNFCMIHWQYILLKNLNKITGRRLCHVWKWHLPLQKRSRVQQTQILALQCPTTTNIYHSNVPQTLTSATLATNTHYHLPQQRPTDTNICYNSDQQTLISATAINPLVLFTNSSTHITTKIKAVVNSALLLVYVTILPTWNLKLLPYNYKATVIPTWLWYLVQ
jgi:hypothetical protein